jgi:hypothetical protein
MGAAEGAEVGQGIMLRQANLTTGPSRHVVAGQFLRRRPAAQHHAAEAITPEALFSQGQPLGGAIEGIALLRHCHDPSALPLTTGQE